MPSQRQLRTLVVGVLIGVVFVLFFTSRLRHDGAQDSRTIQDFYHKTVSGLENKVGVGGGQGQQQAVVGGNDAKDKDGDGNIDADDEQLAQEMSNRLKAAEEKAKEAANRKALKPDPPSEVVGVGNSAKHQDHDDDKPDIRADKEDEEEGEEEEEADEDEAVAIREEEEKELGVGGGDGEEAPAEVDEQAAVETELNTILAQSPVIIFSKSYCPYSKRAKALLLEKYTIEPAPYVVELDEHPLGPALQDYLGGKTQRYTVPNILINGVSIGGADDVTELDKRHKLPSKFKQLGHGKVQIKDSSEGA